MTYEDVKKKYGGQLAERRAHLSHLEGVVKAKKATVEAIERELAEVMQGRWTAEADSKRQELQMRLAEANKELKEATGKILEFNDGGVVARAVANMSVL